MKERGTAVFFGCSKIKRENGASCVTIAITDMEGRVQYAAEGLF